jgi:hypothetical protein
MAVVMLVVLARRRVRLTQRARAATTSAATTAPAGIIVAATGAALTRRRTARPPVAATPRRVGTVHTAPLAAWRGRPLLGRQRSAAALAAATATAVPGGGRGGGAEGVRWLEGDWLHCGGVSSEGLCVRVCAVRDCAGDGVPEAESLLWRPLGLVVGGENLSAWLAMKVTVALPLLLHNGWSP